ncbi:MAG: HAMP domain-containing protein [Kiritimatiellaeota bacterium]|nr:HAMP domain-containing protein [Kiritimatiellota bacterium]
MRPHAGRFQTVTFRLTFWFCAVFAVLSAAVFGLVYAILATSLRSTAEQDLRENLIEFAAMYGNRGLAALQGEFDREAESDGPATVFLVLLGPDLKRKAASDLRPWQGVKFIPSDLTKLPPTKVRIWKTTGPGEERAPALAAAQRLKDGSILIVGTSLAHDREFLENYRVACATGVLAMVLAGGALGWLFARRAMAGVERVTRTAKRIGSTNLAQRVPVGREGREIQDLAAAFNAMLERIQSLVAELREVSNNIAHDLRSPITRIRGLAESAVAGPSEPEACLERAGAIIEECDRLVNLINTMLEIAETDAGASRVDREDIELRNLLLDAYELFLPSAEVAGLSLELSIPPEDSLVVSGDPAKLQRAVANLVDNAIKYTPCGGRVLIAAERTGEWIQVSITDTGVGIAPEKLARVFERFYRGDRSRSQSGNGLGLSLARSIVRAHGGEITAFSRPAGGSTFAVRLRTAV